MMMMELKDSIEQGENQRSKKAKTKAQREEDAAGAKGDLADTTASRNEDQKSPSCFFGQGSAGAAGEESVDEIGHPNDVPRPEVTPGQWWSE